MMKIFIFIVHLIQRELLSYIMYVYIHLHTGKIHTHTQLLMAFSRALNVCSSEGILACLACVLDKFFFFPLCLPQSLNFFSED